MTSTITAQARLWLSLPIMALLGACEGGNGYGGDDGGSSSIIAMFDHELNASTVNATTFFVERSGSDGTFGDGNEVSVVPPRGFPSGDGAQGGDFVATFVVGG
jgi:hypothetical protein